MRKSKHSPVKTNDKKLKNVENKLQIAENKLQIAENKLQITENKLQIAENKLKITSHTNKTKEIILNLLDNFTSENSEEDLDLVIDLLKDINGKKISKTTYFQNKTVQNESVQVKTVQNESVQVKTVQNEIFENETKKSKTVPSGFHSKKCNCLSCNIADFSNQLYNNCKDYVKEKISKDTFVERTIEALNECYFIKNVISKRTHDLLDIYKARSQLYKQKYNDLLKSK